MFWSSILFAPPIGRWAGKKACCWDWGSSRRCWLGRSRSRGFTATVAQFSIGAGPDFQPTVHRYWNFQMVGRKAQPVCRCPRTENGRASAEKIGWVSPIWIWPNIARPFAEKWRRPIGAGWSSFAIAGRYCFTMEQRSELECTTCYDLETGQQLWIHQQPERFREISGGEGPRATPEYVDGLLYTLGATGVLNCLDATTGKVLWSQDVLRAFDATNCLFGACCSPLVVGDLLLVNPGGKNASVVAFNRMNGDLIWQAGDAEASYASLCCMTFDGVKQVLHFNAEGLDAHDLETGAILWSVPWVSNEEERNNVCQPIQISEHALIVSSGYGRGCALIDVRKKNGHFRTETLWKTNSLKSKFASAVYSEGYVYGLDEGIMVCVDCKTGKRTWKNGRYRHGQLLLAGDAILVQAESGYLALVERNPSRFRELARWDGFSHRTWAHPVAVKNAILVRSDREMICFAVTESSAHE